jgi:hypothetical protein
VAEFPRGYGRPVRDPTVGTALGAAIRAVAGEGWLAVLGLGVALLRGLLSLPGSAFVVAVGWLAARKTMARGGRLPDVAAVLAHAWATPRFRYIALGLWLAGLLLWWFLRVAWISGAVPVLAWRLAGARPAAPRFEEGAVLRFHRVLPSAVVALLLDLAGRAMLLSTVLAAFLVGTRAQGSRSPGAAALVAAIALAGAALLAASLSTLGDVAVARASMAGEGPVEALRGAVRSFLRRPAAFLTAILAVALATGLATGSAQGVLGTLASAARAGPRTLSLVPEAMLAVLAALLLAGAELWRLAAVGVLSLASQPWREDRLMSFRSESLGMRPPSQ